MEGAVRSGFAAASDHAADGHTSGTPGYIDPGDDFISTASWATGPPLRMRCGIDEIESRIHPPPTACCACAGRRPLVLRTRGRRHHPGRIRAPPALPRRAGRRRARTEDRVYLRRIQGERMAAGRCFHEGHFDMSASVKAYFALKMIGDDPEAPTTCAAPATRSWRAVAPPTAMYSRTSCSPRLRQVPWRGGADHAGRDHAPAALVPVPPDRRCPTGRAR